MGLLDNYDKYGEKIIEIDTTLGMSPLPAYIHKLIMNEILDGLKSIVDKKIYSVMDECKIDPRARNTKAPDVIVMQVDRKDRLNDKPVMFVEIEKDKRHKKTIENNFKAMEKYDIKESFVYNYEKNTWTKIFDKDTTPNPNPLQSYSDLFQVDIAQFVNTYYK